MTTVQAITRHVHALPEEARREVLDFIEFLESRIRMSSDVAKDDTAVWSIFSLTAAMAGMENESTPYTIADLKESFR